MEIKINSLCPHSLGGGVNNDIVPQAVTPSNWVDALGLYIANDGNISEHESSAATTTIVGMIVPNYLYRANYDIVSGETYVGNHHSYSNRTSIIPSVYGFYMYRNDVDYNNEEYTPENFLHTNFHGTILYTFHLNATFDSKKDKSVSPYLSYNECAYGMSSTTYELAKPIEYYISTNASGGTGDAIFLRSNGNEPMLSLYEKVKELDIQFYEGMIADSGTSEDIIAIYKNNLAHVKSLNTIDYWREMYLAAPEINSYPVTLYDLYHFSDLMDKIAPAWYHQHVL